MAIPSRWGIDNKKLLMLDTNLQKSDKILVD